MAGEWGDIYRARYWNDRTFDVIDAITEVAEADTRSPVEVATGWVLAQPGLTAVLVGASRPEQLDDVAAAANRPLSADSINRLELVSQ
jgi:aryl-alcohol dehydrogenase-like predicted oxidoreductase